MLVKNIPRNVSIHEIPIFINLTKHKKPDWNLLPTPDRELTPEVIFGLELNETENRMREENPTKHGDGDDLLWGVDALIETAQKRSEKRRKTAKIVKRLLKGCTDDLDMVKRVCRVK